MAVLGCCKSVYGPLLLVLLSCFCTCHAATVATGYFQIKALKGLTLEERLEKTNSALVDYLSGAHGNRSVPSVVVFPEFAIGPDSYLSKSGLLPYCLPTAMLQDPKSQGSDLLASFRETAKQFDVVVLLNLCEQADDILYNTDVIIAGDGLTEALYRKTHPFYINVFSSPTTTEHVVVNVPRLGPKIGVFTCFDIAFKEPAVTLRGEGIDTFLYPSALAVFGPVSQSIVELWTHAHNATLVSASYGSTATGCFRHGKHIDGITMSTVIEGLDFIETDI
uniref:CN hydrolase domain-containing protein n=1 Tax=Palpitomonas bilix TaxID=652834 RepID=A0A7S3LY01_9EUKA|mmetsp:Transcript_9150/g.24816  ORF Transcript_9150/g.24816 Transcript_9150/m.24816 type:complete len:278 (+) Transcript_9150:41-874(+)